jgi:hypothetical protein
MSPELCRAGTAARTELPRCRDLVRPVRRRRSSRGSVLARPPACTSVAEPSMRTARSADGGDVRGSSRSRRARPRRAPRRGRIAPPSQKSSRSGMARMTGTGASRGERERASADCMPPVPTGPPPASPPPAVTRLPRAPRAAVAARAGVGEGIASTRRQAAGPPRTRRAPRHAVRQHCHAACASPPPCCPGHAVQLTGHAVQPRTRPCAPDTPCASDTAVDLACRPSSSKSPRRAAEAQGGRNTG